ncbi:PB1 domain [Dillenia turbinata]|uniref:PB1 domain n=1 Tax=Dillenia turbinata TaxID=194707 RepID=A0AAN8ZB10_9MAGN
MEAPPPPAPPLTTSAPPSNTTHLGYSDSVDSSPRSRNADSWDESLPHQQLSAGKLRLMCSYGGHIVPRPHDKSLCYVGGDTRIVVVERQSSLSELSSRLSNSLLSGSPFTLKYQLPNEDLDSLITVTTDEDLDNMIDEYDRTTSSSLKPSRLRLFLFPTKPESGSSIGSLLDNPAKSDDWFLNALNGAVLGKFPGESNNNSVDCLLSLDADDVVANTTEIQQANSKQVKVGQDVHSVPDSPMLETTSSFGSASSSPSLANLPPIRVHVEDAAVNNKLGDQKIGIEEQFSQMGIGVSTSNSSAQLKQDEGLVVLSSPPTNMGVPTVVSVVPIGSNLVSGEYVNRVFSDDERSDQGFRKQQNQAQFLPQQSQSRGTAGGGELASPDSVSSDGSIKNPLSRAKPMIYQDQILQMQSGSSRVSATPVDHKLNLSDPNTRVHIQQIQDSGYVLQSQFDQQQHPQLHHHQQQQQQQPQQQPQFIHASPHYIHHQPTAPVPISSYYHSIYPIHQQQHQHPLDQQQYPVYYVPARQAQGYNFSVQQSNFTEASAAVPSSRPQTPPNPSMVPTPSTFNPNRNAAAAKSDMGTGVYGGGTVGSPLVQVASNQHQQQYAGFSQIRHPSQSIAPTSVPAANYAYEFSDPAHAQIYYTQPMAPTLPPQYQTLTPATATGVPEASVQLSADNIKPQPQLRTSQPLDSFYGLVLWTTLSSFYPIENGWVHHTNFLLLADPSVRSSLQRFMQETLESARKSRTRKWRETNEKYI